MIANVIEKFAGLRPAISGTEFEALALPGSRDDYLAKGSNGNPVFLLKDVKTGQYHPNLQLRYLNAEFQLTCRLRGETEDIEGVFALVSCSAEELELHQLFIRSFDAIRDQLPDKAHTEEIKRTVQNLASLFRAFSKPSQRSISGLWAELFTIAHSDACIQAMKMWRSDPFERFDFSSSSVAVEVKATIGQRRSHEFSLEQLSIPKDGRGFVVSFLLQPINGGTGILDLTSAVEAKIGEDVQLREKLWKNVVGDLGSDFSNALDRRFDLSFVERNLRTFKMEDVPKFGPIEDHRISAVRFTADLSDLPPISTSGAMSDLHSIFNRQLSAFKAVTD